MGRKEKEVFIVLSYTGTLPSKLIRFYTREEFSHVSISLDRNLNKMYSFARLNPYNPFICGFIKENIDSGTYKRFLNTRVEVYALKISERQFRKIEKTIDNMDKNKKIYKYNFIGLIAIIFNIRYKKAHYFYCAEFVKFLMDEAKIKSDLPDLVKPMDFKRKIQMKLIYKGLLREYPNI